MSAPSSLARGSSVFSKFTQLVHGTAMPRSLALLQIRAERARSTKSAQGWVWLS